MKYIIFAGVVVALAIAGLLGFTLGVNLNSESTTRYVLNWGSLGDWVSGIGAFFAVGVALWQAYQMKKEDSENLQIKQRQGNWRWSISIVSCGKRPVRVTYVAIYSKKMDVSLPVPPFIFNVHEGIYPTTLHYSDSLSLVTAAGKMVDLGASINETFKSDYSDLELVINTTLGEFKQPLLQKTKDVLANASKHLFEKARAAAQE